uniref:Uncharacterized protein n=1 Tax=Timema bartmani TaxID=61472 RepID=A0A7R9ET59_9NEOP|nr:unnamed protein product [Timema bartmani]
MTPRRHSRAMLEYGVDHISERLHATPTKLAVNSGRMNSWAAAPMSTFSFFPFNCLFTFSETCLRVESFEVCDWVREKKGQAQDELGERTNGELDQCTLQSQRCKGCASLSLVTIQTDVHLGFVITIATGFGPETSGDLPLCLDILNSLSLLPPKTWGFPPLSSNPTNTPAICDLFPVLTMNARKGNNPNKIMLGMLKGGASPSTLLSKQCGYRCSVERLDTHSGRQLQSPRRNWSHNKL